LKSHLRAATIATLSISYPLLPFASLHERMRSGDAAACGEFYRRYEPFMRSVARYWLSPQTRRHADSADMVQSVFRIAIDHVDDVSFSDEAKVKSWLGRVMRGRVARVARRIRGPGGRGVEDVDEHADDLRDAPSPETVAEHAELVHLMKSTLDRLPERERRLIRLRDFEGRDYAEISELMGFGTADAARKQHARVLERLRGLMARASA
jgi:RNA polymerase sigma-70 factor (ECF subfamily)